MKTSVNIPASEDLLRALYAVGVRDVVFCAGARNAPLVAVLEQTSGFECRSFFEERAAAFFALGRARRDARPVAVITTSGTAAAELLPAVIEAFHTGVPLIVVTADRPRRLRGTGAPQAIDQTGLFAKFLELEMDIEAGAPIPLASWKKQAPLHVNICFDEPLIDRALQALDVASEAAIGSERILTAVSATSSIPNMASDAMMAATAENRRESAQHAIRFRRGRAIGELAFAAAASRVEEFLKSAQKPVAVVGTLDSAAEQEAVEEFLVALGLPVYLEATSGLRESPRLREQALRAGDRVLSWGLAHQAYDSVLRLGGVPTVRIWRDLDEASSRLAVFSLSRLPFAGLSRGEMLQAELSDLLPAIRTQTVEKSSYGALFEMDHMGRAMLVDLYSRYPQAEPSLVRALTQLIPSEALVYVGNSLPIREWDLAGTFDVAHHVQANRGVNGIDGQLSTFLGLLPTGGEGWALVGDLTALYDLTAPWALPSDPTARVRMVVLNNGGGRIFSRIFKNSLFENRHQLGFEGWARMWGLGYSLWKEVPIEWRGSEALRGSANRTKITSEAASQTGSGSEIIELQPDESQTQAFWDAHDRFWGTR